MNENADSTFGNAGWVTPDAIRALGTPLITDDRDMFLSKMRRVLPEWTDRIAAAAVDLFDAMTEAQIKSADRTSLHGGPAKAIAFTGLNTVRFRSALIGLGEVSEVLVFGPFVEGDKSTFVLVGT